MSLQSANSGSELRSGDGGALWQDAKSALARLWQGVLDLVLILWVVRAPFGGVLLGFLIIAKTPQAEDLLIPVADSNPLGIVVFLILHFVLWATPTHYAARLLLNDDRRFRLYMRSHKSRFGKLSELWVPRLLGLATFFVMVLSAVRAIRNLPIILDQRVITAAEGNLLWFIAWSLVFALLFLWYVVKRRAMARSSIVSRAEATATKARPVLDRLEVGTAGSARSLSSDYAQEGSLGRLLLIAEFCLFVFALLLGPSQVAEWLPRAYAIPLVLGGWLPILTYLSALGRRLRAPLIVGVVFVIVILTVWLGNNHDVRTIETDAGAVVPARLKFDEAVHLWMRANGCEATPASCPRPIIIAAAGGASRAGFFTASVIGQLFDKAEKHGLDAVSVRNRLFAISSVSGSSLGVVMTTTALAAGGPNMQMPCPSTAVPLWYGDQIKNWRGCLEALMAGDFLTPTFIGLTFQDVLPLNLWIDRAVLLETSWERRFADIVGRRTSNGTVPDCPANLGCPFLQLRPTQDRWLPLLVLNGTSAGTGQRVVTTLLDDSYIAQPGRCPIHTETSFCPLFIETFYFHDLLNGTAGAAEPPSGKEPSRKLIDVRLSTAAHNSARFPLISPPGGIRNRDHHLVDRIVDGGYFENYGVLTAEELVAAIQAVEPKLVPFVIIVSNDPGIPLDPNEMPQSAGAATFFSELATPVAAVTHARNARGNLGIAYLRAALRPQAAGACNVATAHIRVWPQGDVEATRECNRKLTGRSRAVSMSWWLSTPVQLRLVEELDERSCNRSEFDNIWKALNMKSVCASE